MCIFHVDFESNMKGCKICPTKQYLTCTIRHPMFSCIKSMVHMEEKERKVIDKREMKKRKRYFV